MQTAKLFWSGRSQAVRLPKEFRFETKNVVIRRDGEKVILEPLADDWAWLSRLGGGFDDDVVAATEEEVPMPPDGPESDDLVK